MKVGIFGKSVLTLMLPIVLAWSVLSRLWIETKSIPFFIYTDLRQEWDAYKRTMKEGIL